MIVNIFQTDSHHNPSLLARKPSECAIIKPLVVKRMEKEELQEKIVHPEIVAEVEKKMLSESEFEDLALLFKMFADSTRLKVLKALFEREMCVGDLAELLKMTHSAV